MPKKGLVLAVGLTLAAAATADEDVHGYWLSEEGTAQIELAPCDDDDTLTCGRIVWLDEPYDDDGELLRDTNNDDPELRDREVVGLRIVWDMARDDSRDRRWDGGRIYDPENGNTYRARMTLAEDGETLDLRGYVGIAAFGRTSTWTREASARTLD
ncbi:DUF2147 domain-containing protein [Aquisalimonas asiatica]|uniref:Uncharacterized conserved protein, DUF2147 family n=1 Tax=Aquisalimonas asiatica TaxID=406100 RepID=A0A1H8TX46_9GAMM|nr:DUF2147 domain-containing protein [Aquisalimonas asiatica]SEO95559.1 Uncharacterized conserved protein, DUF2147 family [Aquisalimonas asiatica]